MADINPLPETAPVVIKTTGVTETNKPVAPNTGDTPQSGNPTQPQLSAGLIQNTGIAVSNNNRSHACDTTLFVRRNVSLAAIFEPTITAIRTIIKEILAALGISPGSNAIIEQIKTIKRYVDDVTRLLNKVQKALDALVTVVKKINALISYILSLPARLLALFANCLKELYAELSAQFTDIVKASTGTSNNGESVVQEAQSLLKSTGSLVTTVVSTATQVTSLPATTLSSIMNPSGTTLTDTQAANLASELYSTFDTTKTYEMA